MESSICWRPAFSNGAFHWAVATMTIVAFDLATEKFRPLAFPVPYFQQVLRGCLNFCAGNLVWVMKEYGKAGRWTLLYTVRPSSSNNSEEV
jgi:hypothetical protein